MNNIIENNKEISSDLLRGIIRELVGRSESRIKIEYFIKKALSMGVTEADIYTMRAVFSNYKREKVKLSCN